MPISVNEYTPRWKDTWDEFVRESNNGTIFHLQKFLSYHPENRFAWNHLMFSDGNDIIAVLPTAKMGTTLESPIGASYGSFVTKDIDFGTTLELVDAFSEYCRSNGIERTLLTPPPIIYQHVMSQNLDYALAYRGYSFDKHYISHAIHLRDEDFLKNFSGTARRYIHKYVREQSLTVEASTDLEAFYPILVENKARHGVKPTHSLDELKLLKELFPEEIILFLVRHRGNPIAGSLNFICNSRVLLCFYNMLLYAYEEYNPIHAVMYEVASWAGKRGFQWIDIGVSQDTKAKNQMTPSMGLIRFKEKFDARGIMRSTFYKRFI